jgi:hypothetical protein
MKVRLKNKRSLVWDCYKFNVNAMSEVYIGNIDYGMDTVFIKDLEVWLRKLGTWKSMTYAFKDKDLVTDDFNEQIYETLPGVLTDANKEYIIAIYLVSEYMSGERDDDKLETLAHTTPYPEMAHDLLGLIRRLESEPS